MSDSVHRSRRCSICAVHWPAEDVTLDNGTVVGFSECPHCARRTWGSMTEPDMTADEAASEVSHAQFEQFLDKREEEDAKLLLRVDPGAFAQYLMDAAEEQIEATEPE